MKHIFFIIGLSACLTCSGQSVWRNAKLANMTLVQPSAPEPPATGTEFVTNHTVGTLANNFTGGIGMKIRATATTNITHLGRWVTVGNSGTHTVSIYNSESALLGSVSVNTSGASVGFKYVELSSPVSIESASDYYILSSETSGGDQFEDGATVQSTDIASVLDSGYYDGSCHASGQGADKCHGPVSFKY